ncbi:MAG: cohesin domain-containing protein [Methylococcaceae bacterium]|nr:cohesin domain-containing protein [Methylococcaceae bacterium]MDP3902697.1 cohesin domain-containing protein [Methylococcaceae bacterium]
MITNKIRLFILATLLMLTGITQASVASTFNPTSLFLSITRISQTGNSVNVDIGISGLASGAAPSLSGYDVNLSFDPSYLSFTGVVFGDAALGNQLDLASLGSTTIFELAGAGIVNLFELSGDTVEDLNTLQADSFNLATVTFDVLNAGTSLLQLDLNALVDAGGNTLSAITLSAPVTTVPLPSAFLLMAPALAGLMCAGKRRQKDFRA